MSAVALGRQASRNRLLSRGRSEDTTVGQQRYGVLSIGAQTFVGGKDKRFVPIDGKPQSSPELLASQRILEGRTCSGEAEIGERRVGSQRRAKRKRIAGVQSIIAEEAEEPAVHGVGARLGHNVDGSATGPTQLGGVVAAVNLKFLHCILAQGQADTAGVIVGFAAVHGYAVTSSVAAIE